MGNSPPPTPVRPTSYKDASTQTPTKTPIFPMTSTRIPAWKRAKPAANPATYSNYMAIQQGKSLLAGVELRSPSPSPPPPPSTIATSSVTPGPSVAKPTLTAARTTANIAASSSVATTKVTPNIVGGSRATSRNVDTPSVTPSIVNLLNVGKPNVTPSIVNSRNAGTSSITPNIGNSRKVGSRNVSTPNVTPNIASSSNVGTQNLTRNVGNSRNVGMHNVTPNIASSSNVGTQNFSITALPPPRQITLGILVLFYYQPGSIFLGEGTVLVGIGRTHPPPAGDIYAQLLIDIWYKSGELGRPRNYNCRHVAIRWGRDPDLKTHQWLEDTEIENAEVLDRVLREVYQRRLERMPDDALVAWFVSE